MYTPFHVYTNYIFPFLAILGLACLLEGSFNSIANFQSFPGIFLFPGILIQFKREGAKKTRFWTPYRLADAKWLVSIDRRFSSNIDLPSTMILTTVRMMRMTTKTGTRLKMRMKSETE